MKLNALFGLLVALAFIISSCGSTADSNKVDETTEDDVKIEDTRGVDMNESKAQDEDFSLIFSKKWTGEEAFVDLKIDGSFDAKFGEDEPVHGKWTLSEDLKTLKLVGDQAADGKGHNFVGEYTVLEINDSAMKVQDKDGKDWSFSAE
ncbi:MAG: hypothetical protein GY810_05825 [Aureispira sp.]|nr:hypothetical protein [Aureispira sp.]